MHYAITKELVKFNFEQQTTDWLVAEFDAWCIESKMTDARGHSLFQVGSARGTNKAHMQTSNQLWSRCNLIQNTVKNFILDVPSGEDKDALKGGFRAKDDEKLTGKVYIPRSRRCELRLERRD